MVFGAKSEPKRIADVGPFANFRRLANFSLEHVRYHTNARALASSSSLEPRLLVYRCSEHFFFKLLKLHFCQQARLHKTETFEAFPQKNVADLGATIPSESDYITCCDLSGQQAHVPGQCEKFALRIDKLRCESLRGYFNILVGIVVAAFDLVLLDHRPVKIMVLEFVNKGEQLRLKR